MQAMLEYASNNQATYPLLPFAPYSSTNAAVSTSTLSGKDAKEVIDQIEAGKAQNGSVLGSLWILVLGNYTTPKQYLCKSDSKTTFTPSALFENTNDYHVNFQSANQIRYSFAYPYNPDGSTGNWWKNTQDMEVPIMSDMAPLNGTGNPIRHLSPGHFSSEPGVSRQRNSGNHNSDGQNVGFADGHAEFDRNPGAGQKNDNIFTISGTTAPSEFGGTQPGKSSINILTKDAPYDIVMVPARNLDTGGF